MGNYQDIIDKYYINKKAKNILITHGKLVYEKALLISQNKPELNIDEDFIEEAAMLHDIGIFLTYAPEIDCFGAYPYICHGYLGRELLDKEKMEKAALVAERHTGAGLSSLEIKKQNLPLPHRDMIPLSIEEQLICFTDKFFSKTKNSNEIPISKIRKKMLKYGEEQLKRFDNLVEIFL